VSFLPILDTPGTKRGGKDVESMEILTPGIKMRLCTVILILLLLSVVLSGCFPFYLLGDPGYGLCAFMTGAVADSSTHEPLQGVQISAFHYKSVIYADSTNSTGVYQSSKIRRLFSASRKTIRELESKPPLRKELDLRIVFEKPGYKTLELPVPVEFVYCSRHPQPAEIPEAKIPDVFLVKE
jgi:hypothetical protein